MARVLARQFIARGSFIQIGVLAAGVCKGSGPNGFSGMKKPLEDAGIALTITV
jgi:hypothetical protein